MGIKEFNSLVKNLFQTGLKAFSPFRRGERFIFFLAQSLPVGRQDAETQRGIESSPLRLFCFARVFNFLMVLRWSRSTVFICFFLVT